MNGRKAKALRKSIYGYPDKPEDRIYLIGTRMITVKVTEEGKEVKKKVAVTGTVTNKPGDPRARYQEAKRAGR